MLTRTERIGQAVLEVLASRCAELDGDETLASLTIVVKLTRRGPAAQRGQPYLVEVQRKSIQPYPPRP